MHVIALHVMIYMYEDLPCRACHSTSCHDIHVHVFHDKNIINLYLQNYMCYIIL